MSLGEKEVSSGTITSILGNRLRLVNRIVDFIAYKRDFIKCRETSSYLLLLSLKKTTMNRIPLIFVSMLTAFASIAQTSTYADFVKKADILKKSPKMGGCLVGSENDGKYVYTIATMDFRAEIVSVEKKDGLVSSFVLNLGNDCWDAVVKPNDETFPTHWVAPGSKDPIVFFKEYFVELEKVPTDLASLRVRAWYKINGLSLKEAFKYQMDGPKGTIVPPFTNEELYADMKPFIDAQAGGAAAAAADKKAKAAEHLAKYSIKGKTVTKIEVMTNSFSSLGYKSTLKIGVKATLSDGTVILTKNLGGEGYLEDYDIKVVGNVKQDYSGDYIVGENPSAKEDIIKIEVTSKHHATFAKATNAIAMTYNSNVELFFNGRNITNTNGENGESLKIEVRSISHTSTSDQLVEYKIVRPDGAVIVVRLKPENVLKVNARGGNGNYRGDSPTNGGNGGNITIYVDPKVGSNYNLVTNNPGGDRGVVPKKEYLTGVAGSDGKVTTIVQTLN